MDAGPRRRDVSYRSGTVEIDSLRRCVSIEGTPAKLGSRAFDLLLALVERRDRVVSKRELMDVVWPRLVVEEGNLLVQVVALRKLLGPQAILTLPGRGYRFVLPIDATLSGAASDSASPTAQICGNLHAAPELFGRARDLASVEALLRDHPVVTIVGAAGMGKTSVALSAAATQAWPHGCWWVELAPVTDGALVPATIAAAMRVPPSATRSPAETLAMALRSRHLLLVLDNCEHLADDVAPLIDTLRDHAPDVRLLVTSQESLKCRNEHVYRLGPLAVPVDQGLEDAARFGAVALFAERAHAADSRFRLAEDNVGIVVDICRRLDGIPLAIELAAARVPLLGVHALQSRLATLFGVLTGGSRMKLRRYQTLRAAFEWSYGLLSADEQLAFRQLGVFADGFSLELAQALVTSECTDSWRVLDVLGHLIDKSLVMADGEPTPRYRLLETTRAFALEQLAAHGESDAMLRRHARVVCDALTVADANCWNLSPAERRRVTQELGNLRAATEWAQSGGDAALGYELLARGWLVWLHHGIVAEGVARMRALWPPAAPLPDRVEADFCLALARLNGGAARDIHWEAVRRAEALYRRSGDTARLGDALMLVGTVGLALGHVAEAEHALREAEGLVDESSMPRRRAALAATQGECFMFRGAPELAIAAFRRQQGLYGSIDSELGEYLALGNVGSAQLQSGDIAAAVGSLRESVDGLSRLRAPYGREHRLGMLALALAHRGDDASVLALGRKAHEQLKLLGTTSAPMLAAALHHAQRGDLRRAALLAGHALDSRRCTQAPLPIFLEVQRHIRDSAGAAHPITTVESWLRAGERLNEDEAAAIAFDAAPTDG